MIDNSTAIGKTGEKTATSTTSMAGKISFTEMVKTGSRFEVLYADMGDVKHAENVVILDSTGATTKKQ